MYMDSWKPENALIPNDIYFTNWKNFYMDYHTHEPGSIEINYVTKGRCEYRVNGKVIQMKAKNMIIINAVEPHRLVFTENEPSLIMGIALRPCDIRPGFVPLKDMLSAFDGLASFMQKFDDYMIMRDGHLIYPLIKNIINEFKEYKSDAYEALLVNQMLVNIARLICNDEQQLADYVGQAKSYIYRHYYSIKSVDDIASAVGLNKSYLQKIFKEQMKISLWNFLNETRLEYAASALANSHMTVEQIYESIGINSRQNFNGMFKKKYGMTPLEYRRCCQ